MYPVMLNVENKLCTIIGGGFTALRKAESLAQNGAEIKVISPEFCDGFNVGLKIQKTYEPSDIKDSFLVIAATNDKMVNRKVAEDAKNQKILAYLVDDAEMSDFVSPAVSVCGDISLSVSTNGKFPLLAKKLSVIKSSDLDLYKAILPIIEKYRQLILHENRDTKKEILRDMISDDMIMMARENLILFEQKVKDLYEKGHN